MNFRFFLLATWAILVAPTAVFAVWGQPGPITSHRSCSPCQCLGPLASSGFFDEFCSAIAQAPCSTHIRSVTPGLWQYISANAPGCNIIWAPTKSQCMQHVAILQTGRDPARCAALMDVRNFAGVRMATLAMGGQCIPGAGAPQCPSG